MISYDAPLIGQFFSINSNLALVLLGVQSQKHSKCHQCFQSPSCSFVTSSDTMHHQCCHVLPKPNPEFNRLRALDSELRAHVKGNDPSFDINKLAFFAEATGTVQEGHILEAQNAVANARKSSLQAGFNLFRTSLGNDQVLHERHLAASKTDEAKARSAVLGSLEAGWVITNM